MGTMAYLYRYEAKAIQSYLLQTQKLKEMAGASRLVDTLGSDVKAAFGIAQEALFVAAGGGTFVFDTEEKLRRVAEMLPVYVERTRPGLELVQAWVPLEGREGERFRRSWGKLHARLGEARQCLRPNLPVYGPLVQRSGRTGRAAVAMENGSAVCASIQKKRQACQDEEFRYVLPVLLKRGVWNTEEISQTEVAVIHADVNQFGQFLAENELGAEEYKRVSEALANAVKLATQETLTRMVGREMTGEDEQHRINEKVLPGRIVVLGGDDLTLIIPAWHAVSFARALIESFREKSRQVSSRLRPDGFYVAVGIAFVKPSFPFSAAYSLCEELCGAAKVRHGRGTSALLFHRVTTPVLRSWDGILEEELGVPGSHRVLAGGPWIVGDNKPSPYAISALARVWRASRSLSRGPMREWLRLLQVDPDVARTHWTRFCTIQLEKREDAFHEFEAAMRDAGADIESGFRGDDSCPLADALVLRSIDSRWWS
jgi:hypothetical protein